ncbi:MAG: type III-A CRISPR-associated RAMP protein Csm4 [Aggregatilineales bacterium]
MNNITPIQLTFRSGLHIGATGVDLEESSVGIPADTLFAALVDARRRSGEAVDVFLAPFVSAPPDPPFVITSAFPYAGGVRFYPAPVDMTELIDEATLAKRGKAIRSARYMSEGLFLRALNGEKLDAWLFPADEADELTDGVALQGGQLWLTKDEVQSLPDGLRPGKDRLRALRYRRVWSEDRTPRVTVDRVTNASTIFHAGRVSFARGCGLWFGVRWLRPDQPVKAGASAWREAFMAGLFMLADDGIGGERSAGYGAFSMQAGAPFSLPLPTAGQRACLLSRYHPRADELPGAIAGEDCAYGIVSVGGWMRAPGVPAQRRKRIAMLVEGSLVRLPSIVAGDVADVKPEYEATEGEAPHGVYRYGIAFGVAWPRRALGGAQ